MEVVIITNPVLAGGATDTPSWSHPASKLDPGSWIQSYENNNYWDSMKSVEVV